MLNCIYLLLFTKRRRWRRRSRCIGSFYLFLVDARIKLPISVAGRAAQANVSVSAYVCVSLSLNNTFHFEFSRLLIFI